jgi:uncharacterized protein (DUF2141 family)
MTESSRTPRRLAQASLLCILGLAFSTASLSGQAPAAPAPAPAPAVPAAPAPAAAPAAAPAPAVPQGASTLTIKIKGIRNAKGKIGVVLYANSDGFPLDPSNAAARKQVDIDPQTLTATVVFDNLAPGAYAAVVLHDEKMIGKMEFDSSGIPLEGYGVTNNPDSSQGPPTFDESKVPVKDANTATEISMVYWQ